MLALSALALLWGWAREASLIMLGWAGVLRAGELFAAFRADLVLPRDAAPGTYHALVKIRQPKTRGRAAKHQAVRIDPSDVVALLSAVFGNLSSAEPLWPLSPATLRKRFSLLQASLGLGLQTSLVGCPSPWLLFDQVEPHFGIDQTLDSEFVRRERTLDQFAGARNLPPRSCSCNFCRKNDRGFQTQS